MYTCIVTFNKKRRHKSKKKLISYNDDNSLNQNRTETRKETKTYKSNKNIKTRNNDRKYRRHNRNNNSNNNNNNNNDFRNDNRYEINDKNYNKMEDNLDREWYVSNAYDPNENDGEIKKFGGKSSTYLTKQERIAMRNNELNKVDKKINVKMTQLQKDQNKWEEQMLNRSGIVNRLNKSDNIFEEEIEHRVNILVRDIKPPFLDINNKDNVYSQSLNDVDIVRDRTSDMSVIASKISPTLQKYRENRDKKLYQQKWWKVGHESRQGKVLGIENDMKSKNDDINQELNERGEYDYKKDNQFSKAMSGSIDKISNFSKQYTLQEQREKLPIFRVKDQFLNLISEWQIIILVGETGSGKTTQLSQYLYESGYSNDGRIIVCTQPRRVAAMSVAKRVAQERNVKLGNEVGYAIRFEDCTSDKTRIKYCTDGVLLREILNENGLDKYSVIIMDEAHERSLNTDILFGVFKKILSERQDLKLIVTSATLDAKKFQTFFNGCPIFNVPGRTFKVDVNWSKKVNDDPLDAAIKTVIKIHLQCGSGDILVFMTGQEDINACCALIAERLSKHDNVPGLTILPIYSQLPADLQAKIFKSTDDNSRKCIISTNIAETSVTVDGIKYVVDTGYCKLKQYRSNMGLDTLTIVPISKANANQRKGRAGRTGNGEVFRLYTPIQYELEMLDMTVPEIQRTNLCNVVLLLKSLNIDNLLLFDFMDKPPKSTLLNALHSLWVLNALNNNGNLTNIGKQMIEFPLDPNLSKMLIYSINMGKYSCSNEILTIVSMLSVPNIYYRPNDKSTEADNIREKFLMPESDHLTLLNIYQEWKRKKFNDKWLKEHYIHIRTMKRVREIRSQLVDIMIKNGYNISTPIDNNLIHVRKAICSSYFINACKLKNIGEYINLRKNISCYLHPSSSLFGIGYTPDYIIYHELIFTSKEYMRNVTTIKGEWLPELGSMFYTIKNNKISLKRQNELEREIIKQDIKINKIKKNNDKILNKQNIIKKQKLSFNKNIITVDTKIFKRKRYRM